jgi:hypothetical protein
MSEKDIDVHIAGARLTVGPSATFGKTAFGKMTKWRGLSIDAALEEAVAMWIDVQEQRKFFDGRRKSADFEALRQVLKAKGGEEPRPGDEIPPGYTRHAS